jgi:hypothetical protein
VRTPLAETFAAVPAPAYGAHTGPPPAGDWLDVAALTGDAGGLERLMAVAAAGYDTDRRDIKGIRLVELWTWVVAAPAAASVLLARRLPDLAAANLRLNAALFDVPGPVALRAPRFWCLPDDADADHPDATVVADERALLAELNAALAARHLAPLIASVSAMTGRGPRALWRGAADRVVDAFTWTGEQLGRVDEAAGLARLAVDAEPPLRARARMRVYAFAGLAPHTLHLRDGCCLYYRLPDGPKCVNCPLLDDSERAARLEADLRRAPSP